MSRFSAFSLLILCVAKLYPIPEIRIQAHPVLQEGEPCICKIQHFRRCDFWTCFFNHNTNPFSVWTGVCFLRTHNQQSTDYLTDRPTNRLTKLHIHTLFTNRCTTIIITMHILLFSLAAVAAVFIRSHVTNTLILFKLYNLSHNFHVEHIHCT